MKERFWIFYFYLMWTLYLLGCAWIVYAWYMRFEYGDVYYEGFYTYRYDELTDRAFLFTLLTSLPMWLIRWIATGKHFWQKP